MKRTMIAAFCVAATFAQAAGSAWTIVDLGALGPAGSTAAAINGTGDVAGSSRARDASGAPTGVHGFLHRGGAMYDIGVPAPSNTVQINAMGSAGTIAASGDFGMGYLWKDGQWSPMNFHGTPQAINAFDQVVGHFPLGAGERAFLYANGHAEELGTLGGLNSRANAINDAGLVVGSSTLAGESATHAFIYENGAMRDLGTLGGTYSTASAINSQGIVVGKSTDASGRTLAFIYDAGGMRPLLNMPGAQSAIGISDRGAVVGLIDDGAFLYDSGAFTRLDQLPEVRAAGWAAIFPVAVNERGWITGWGWHADGRPGSAFLMIPPAQLKMMWSTRLARRGL